MKTTKKFAAPVLVLSALVSLTTGCATNTGNLTMNEQSLLKERDAWKNKAESAETENREIREKLQLAESRTENLSSSSTGLLPPNAQPGHCYTRVYVAPTYKTEDMTMKVRDESSKMEIQPATYRWVEKQVLVKEASSHLKVIPATYKWVEETVMVEPEKTELVEVPAQYETVTEKVLDKPAHTVWKKGTGPIQKIDSTTGEIMCLVEVPATYKTITKTVLKTPATVKEVTKPAVNKVVKRKVVDKAEHTVEVKEPSVYKTIKVKELVEPAKSVKRDIPAEYKTITKQLKVSDGYLEWREILCETNINRDVIFKLQQALSVKGYNPGPIDGIIGVQTVDALNRFQKANKLPVDKHLNMESLKALNVI